MRCTARGPRGQGVEDGRNKHGKEKEDGRGAGTERMTREALYSQPGPRRRKTESARGLMGKEAADSAGTCADTDQIGLVGIRPGRKPIN